MRDDGAGVSDVDEAGTELLSPSFEQLRIKKNVKAIRQLSNKENLILE